MEWLRSSGIEDDVQFKDAIGPIVDEIKAAIKGAEENIDDISKLKETIKLVNGKVLMMEDILRGSKNVVAEPALGTTHPAVEVGNAGSNNVGIKPNFNSMTGEPDNNGI